MRTITEMNLERLREVTNGKAGVLTLFPPDSDPNHQTMDCSDYKVYFEEVVTQEETRVIVAEEILPPTVLELAAENKSAETLVTAATSPLEDVAAVLNLAEATKDQSRCDEWFKYRVGRITASNLFRAAHKVKGCLPVYRQ